MILIYYVRGSIELKFLFRCRHEAIGEYKNVQSLTVDTFSKATKLMHIKLNKHDVIR